jgi:hypothetical protein
MAAAALPVPVAGSGIAGRVWRGTGTAPCEPGTHPGTRVDLQQRRNTNTEGFSLRNTKIGSDLSGNLSQPNGDLVDVAKLPLQTTTRNNIFIYSTS